MLKKRKLAAWGAVVCLLMLAMSSVTVFAAEETTESMCQRCMHLFGRWCHRL